MLKKSHTRYFHLKYIKESLVGVKGKILDVGCGSGWILNNIKSKKYEMYGCDIKKNNKYNFKFKKSDAQNLKYKNNNFDYVLVTDVIEHVINPNKCIKEISRVLKNGGKFHLVVPVEAEPYTIDGMVKIFLNKNQKLQPIGHIQQFKIKEIKNMLTKNRFEITKVRYSYHFIYQLLSFIYFTNLNITNNGKYKPLKANQSIIDFAGWFVYIEDLIFAKLAGQEMHIDAILKK